MREAVSVRFRAEREGKSIPQDATFPVDPQCSSLEDEAYVAELATKAMEVQTDPQRAARGLPPVVDFIVALLAFILTAPLMLVIAFLIRLDSPGPVIFRQVRIGRDRRQNRRRTTLGRQSGELEGQQRERRSENILGQPFVLYKFRTMRNDGREVYPHLYNFDLEEEEISDLHLAMPQDPRVTRVGHFLRRTSLDELPNFFNILKGEMALVGPRPELPDVARYYKDWQNLKFQVKPGLTGKAQISGRGFLSFEETIVYDVEYVLERSFRTDVQILWKTVASVVKGSGAF